LSVIIIAYYIV